MYPAGAEMQVAACFFDHTEAENARAVGDYRGSKGDDDESTEVFYVETMRP